jgi:restriction system protein
MDDSKETTVWSVRGGRDMDSDLLFLEHNLIAIGWPEMSDLSKLPPDREAFRDHFAEAFPTKGKQAVSMESGQLYRFAHEIRKGDFVVYYSVPSKTVHIGTVIGDYAFDESPNSAYPHHRSVRWLKSAPREEFSRGGFKEVTPPKSISRVRNNATEFVEKVCTTREAKTYGEEHNVFPAIEDIDQKTHDFVKRCLVEGFTPLLLAQLVDDLLVLIHSDDLVEMVLQHYTDLDPRFKSLIPLRKTYVPCLLQDPAITMQPDDGADKCGARNRASNCPH